MLKANTNVRIEVNNSFNLDCTVKKMNSSAKRTLIFVTGNPNKLKEVGDIDRPSPFNMILKLYRFVVNKHVLYSLPWILL